MQPKFPLKVPPRCRLCGNPCTRSSTSDLNQYGNAGRPYYTCPKNPQYHLTSIFICFDDDIGVDRGNPRCDCGYTSRRTLRNDGEHYFFSCAVGGCRWMQNDYTSVATYSMRHDGLEDYDYLYEDMGMDEDMDEDGIDDDNPDCSCGCTSRRILGDDGEGSKYFFVCAIGHCDWSQADDTPLDTSSMSGDELDTKPGLPAAPASSTHPTVPPGASPIGSTASSALPMTPTKPSNSKTALPCTPGTTASRPATRPSGPVPVDPFGPMTPPASASKSGIKQELDDPLAAIPLAPVTPPSSATKSTKTTATQQTRSIKRLPPSRSTRRLISVLARRHRRVESSSRHTVESTRELAKDCQTLPRLSRRQAGGRLPWRLRPLRRGVERSMQEAR